MKCDLRHLSLIAVIGGAGCASHVKPNPAGVESLTLEVSVADSSPMALDLGVRNTGSRVVWVTVWEFASYEITAGGKTVSSQVAVRTGGGCHPMHPVFPMKIAPGEVFHDNFDSDLADSSFAPVAQAEYSVAVEVALWEVTATGACIRKITLAGETLWNATAD